VVTVMTKKALARHSLLISNETSRIVKVLQEGLGGIRDVLIDGTQSTYTKIFQRSDLPLRFAQGSVQIIKFSPRFGIEAAGISLIGGLSYMMVSGPSGFLGAIPTLGAMALGAQRLLPLAQGIYACWAGLRSSRSICNDVLKLLDQPLPMGLAEEGPERLPFEDNLAFEDLTFRYQQDAPWVLEKGLSFKILKGSRVGLMGATGSGKSTLLDIAMGLLTPTSGRLTVDGVALTGKNCRSWQRHIAHVPQAIFLSDASIAENIAFGIESADIDHDRVREVARKAQIATTIESWKDQYETFVGERGVRLSGGQRQRLGIARALYREADVIVLDEATSALDEDTENNVMKAIEDLAEDITILIVAHRLSTLRKCSQVIELEQGQIKRIGSYADLVGSTVTAGSENLPS